MKTLKFTLMAVLLSVFVSCSDNKITQPAGVTGLTEDIHFVQDGEIGSMGMIEHYEKLLEKASESNADDAAYIKYLQDQMEDAEHYCDSLINVAGANGQWDQGTDGAGGKNRLLGYQFATIRYKSIDHYGNPIMLSTLVVWPYNNLFPNPAADNVIIGCHVTISSNAERPTNYINNSIMSDVGMLACCAKSTGLGASYENLVIIPDYQGYGATHGEPHPYLSQDLTARQVLDGVRAGIKYYEQSHKLEKGWKSVSTGYSQGGSVAMAVHRYIERNNLESEFNFAGSVCGNGPYDPVATLQKYMQQGTNGAFGEVYMPVSAAMMMYSMCKTNPRLMGKYTHEDFLSEKFLATGIIDMIEDKQLNTDQVQEELFKYCAEHNSSEGTFCMQRLATDGYYHTYAKDTKDLYTWESGYIKTAFASPGDMLEYYTNVYFRDNGKTDGITGDYTHVKLLKSALEDNILYRDWKPAHPIFLYHTEEDEVVVFQNYRNCLDAWKGSKYVHGRVYKGTTHTHVNYGSVFYMMHCGAGISAILSGRADSYPFEDTISDIL